MRKLEIKVDEKGETFDIRKEDAIIDIFREIDDSYDLVKVGNIGNYRTHIIKKVKDRGTRQQLVSDKELDKIIVELNKIKVSFAKTAKALKAEFDKIEKLGN